MIEVTLTDILLFGWATIATVYMFKYKEQALVHKFMIHKILTDEKMRTDLVEGYHKTFGNKQTQ